MTQELTELEKKPESAVALARVAESVAIIRASVEVAQACPRDEDKCRDRALKSMTRPSMADAAEYCFPRGKTDVTGASVKLARELARCWGNIQHGLRIISRTDKEVHIEGWAWDVEANSRVIKESRFAPLVQRKIGKWPNQKTEWVVPDERDLNELIAKRGAVLTRNAILELIPGDLTDECRAKASDTLASVGKQADGEDREAYIGRACSAFKAYGITREQIEKRFGEWTPETVATLRRVFNSIKDGMAKPSEFFGDGVSADSALSTLTRLEAAMKEAEPEPEDEDVAIMRGAYDGTNMFARDGEAE